jgi:hypothetical protein
MPSGGRPPHQILSSLATVRLTAGDTAANPSQLRPVCHPGARHAAETAQLAPSDALPNTGSQARGYPRSSDGQKDG